MALIKAENLPKTTAAFSMADIEQHARGILAKAKAQADQIIANANAIAEKTKAGAAAAGKAEGVEIGKKEGREQAMTQARNQALTEQKAKLVETISTLHKTAQALDARMKTIQQEAQTELIPLALAIARRVARLSADKDLGSIQMNVQEAIRIVMNKTSLRIALHPSQREAVDTLLPQLKMQWPAMQHIELIDDPTLATGGCRVYSAGGIVDADLDVQIDRIANELACGGKDEA